MDTATLRELIRDSEGLKLDFKRQMHRIDHPDSKARSLQADELIKDILALENGNVGTAHDTAHLIIGAEDKLNAGGTRDLSDVGMVDVMQLRRRIIDLVNGACHPSIPDILCDIVELGGVRLLVISLPPSPHLHETTRRLETPKAVYQENTVFVRRAEGTGVASTAERIEIIRDKNGARSDIHAPAQRPAVIFQAPPLPPHFIPRSEVLTSTKPLLLAGRRPGLEVLAIGAIHGMGGIGKSTLAAALAHDSEVQTHYKDGILWVTLGQDPDLVSLLTTWIHALGDYDFHPASVEAASAHLRTLLHAKDALLVVDDAWDHAHVRPFVVGGPGCRLLITTREANVARALGATIYKLDVMTTEQAISLCAAKLGGELLSSAKDYAARIASLVGYLPLALELAAAQVADGVRWSELTGDLEAEIVRLQVLDFPDADDVFDENLRKSLSLQASFNLSLRRLSAERLQQFAWLGIVAEDAILAPAMAATLWGIDERNARDSLRYLHDKALLLSGARSVEGPQTYRLHDLVRTVARGVLVVPNTLAASTASLGLGLSLSQAHAQFLERSRPRSADGSLLPWSQLADDGYLIAHLVWHMLQARWMEEIHRLLAEETDTGRNAWYQARDRLGQTAGYVDDLRRAWRLAQDTTAWHWKQDRSGASLGLEVRYALIISSLNSISGNIPPPLVSALVERGVWTHAQGLGYARQAPTPEQQALVLPRLVPQASSQALQDIMQSIEAIRDDRCRDQALARVAPHLPPSQLLRALASARSIQKGEQELATAVICCRLVQSGMIEEGLQAATTIQDARRKSRCLMEIASLLPEPRKTQVEEQALSLAQSISRDDDRALAIAELAPFLSPDLIKRSIPLIAGIRRDWMRQEALAKVIPFLPTDLLELIEQVVRGITDERWRARALADFASHAPTNASSHILEIAHDITDDILRARVQISVAARLAEDGDTDEAMKIISTVTEDGGQRIKGYARLATHLPESQIQHLLAQVMALRTDGDRAKALEWLSPTLSVSLLQEALVLTQSIRDTETQDGMLTELAIMIARAGDLKDALSLVRTIKDETARSSTLVSLQPYLDKPHVVVAFAAAMEMQAANRLQALIGLAPVLPPVMLTQAIELARADRIPTRRSWALSRLAFFLPESESGLVTRGLIDDVLSIADDTQRINAITAMAPFLSRGQGARVIRHLATISDAEARQRVLSVLIPGPIARASISQAFGTALALRDDDLKVQALLPLIPQLDHPMLDRLLDETMRLKSEWARLDILLAAGGYLPLLLVKKAVSAIVRLKGNQRSLLALVGVWNGIPEADQEHLVGNLLDQIRTIPIEHRRRMLLKHLAPQLSEHQIGIALQKLRNIEDEREWLWWMSVLFGVLPQATRNANLHYVLTQILPSRQRTARHAALRNLAETMLNVPQREWTPLWNYCLETSASRTRADLLSDLQALSPIIGYLGGQGAILEVADAICTARRWWP